jgi:hypothetical protein
MMISPSVTIKVSADSNVKIAEIDRVALLNATAQSG